MENETEKKTPVEQRCLVLPLFEWGGDKYPVIAELKHGFKLVAHKNCPAITDGDRFSTLNQYDDDPEGLKDVKRQAYDKLQEFVWIHIRPMLDCPTYGHNADVEPPRERKANGQ
jgi:hypothetical protein